MLRRLFAATLRALYLQLHFRAKKKRKKTKEKLLELPSYFIEWNMRTNLTLCGTEGLILSFS